MIAAAVKIVSPPADKPAGWDLADALAEGWTGEYALAFMQAHFAVAEQDGPPADDVPPHGDGDEPPPFQPLGLDHGRYFYLARGARQVYELSGAGHTKAGLMTLAPLQYWEREYPSKGGANWDMAANALIRMSEKAGVYDAMRVRGRGAWWEPDAKRAVLHLGDRLIVGGSEHDVTAYKSRFIYEAAPPLRIQAVDPLPSSEAIQLVEICKLLPWEKSIHALLLAGWCVVAPVCGALKWRPHVWMTGPSGVGKSWIYEQILVKCLGEVALAAASETTEAGLRQVLGTDARPIVFDEAEGETAKAQARIANVLALMRQSSSETSAAIYKGTAGGEGQRFITRSCFAFSSIGVGLQQHADQTRVTVLPLQLDMKKTKEERAAHFNQVIEPLHLKTITPEFVDRLHARTVSLVPTIRANAETFAVAGAAVIGTRRLGDQIGALLAGAYSLHSNKEISLEDARAWIKKHDWTDETHAQEQRDEIACLQHLLQHVLGVQTEKGRLDRSIAELISRITGDGPIDMLMPADIAHDVLRRHGIRIDGETNALVISNSHTGLARVLANTPWARNWRLILRRLPGAASVGPMRFGGSPPERAVAVPIGVVAGDAPPMSPNTIAS